MKSIIYIIIVHEARYEVVRQRSANMKLGVHLTKVKLLNMDYRILFHGPHALFAVLL